MHNEEAVSRIERSIFLFENRLTKVIAVRNSPKIDLAGLSLGPFEEGIEYEVKFWIADELEKTGIVRLKEETLTAPRLYQILHKERIQPALDLSQLPEDFYPRIRRLVDELKRSSKSSPEKMREYENAQKLSKDIINCRLKKIVSLASTPGQKSQALRNLTPEELYLYERLEKIISDWRSMIL
ncbi:MAG: hypothetical protein RMJ07_03545 [Nitrososphaerota archaeon]|nr:hypothetical protein [Candidatus Bathyarchaeota archaeon]MDW8048736.1 hypothetical protein [Nitrososphaerota archaeon]